MKQIKLGTSELLVPNIALGCMRLAGKDVKAAEEIIATAQKVGMNFYDHADIYGGGESEKIFSAAVKNLGLKREDYILQSKCGIRKGFFDFSKDHILTSVDEILSRLQEDYLDVLLLHRPDTLFDPLEVNEAFKVLHKSGKVKYFGISNQNPTQIELMKKTCTVPLVANQLQFSIMHTGMIDAGFNVNMRNDAGINRDAEILEYCRLHNMTIQAWSPFQYGFFEGVFVDNDKFPELNEVMQKIADKYSITKTGLAVAWILRHPAQMQVIIGSMTPSRIKECAAASSIEITREEWYEIYRAAGNILP